MHEFCAILSGILVWTLMFIPMFNNANGFWGCVRFWLTPDVFSLFHGEWTEDWWAELKLGLWFISGIFAGFASWIFYRPWISEALLIGVLALMVLPKLLKKKATSSKKSIKQASRDQKKSAPTPPQKPQDSHTVPSSPMPHVHSKDELNHLSPPLISVLELCTMYLVAMDEQFTPIEQDWVDAKFGPGTADQFISKMPTMDWETCFSDIHNELLQLEPKDQFYMKSVAATLFQTLMESDGLETIEQDRLDGLMRYIRESLENKDSTVPAIHTNVAGELSQLNPPLLNVLELCTMYLVALDEQFTPIEQDWVDAKFGPGASERFIAEMPAMDWENCFGNIFHKLIQLNPSDQLYMDSQAADLFQNLMEFDGLEAVEQEQLDGLM
jgi:hypothetical protein